MSFADTLRSYGSTAPPERRDAAKEVLERFEELKTDIDAAAKERRASHGEYVVLEVLDGDDRLLDFTDCHFSELEDPPEVVERARRNLVSRSESHLRGNAAKLRDRLKDLGLMVSIRHRVAGHGCRSYHVWNLVASW